MTNKGNKKTFKNGFIASSLMILLFLPTVFAQSLTPAGEMKGTGFVHSAESLAASLSDADVVLPAKLTGNTLFVGKFSALPQMTGAPVPTLIFMHGSSGLALPAIGQWQKFIAELGYASIALNSFTLANRVTYKSPISQVDYERIHQLRASELTHALSALKNVAWIDKQKLMLAGTSEGAVAVARHSGTEFSARIIYAWSCEANYFVEAPRNGFEKDKPILNVISSVDPFFSSKNSFIGNASAVGHCGEALKNNPKAAITLIPDAPHTLLMLPAVRAVTQGFLQEVLVK
jgi:hypothetical protein